MSRRLNLNINAQTEAALHEVASELNVSFTEALRILVGMGIHAYRWERDGYALQVKKNGTRETITWAGVR